MHEDHVGWVDNSSIKKKILKYNDKFDDYDIMNWDQVLKIGIFIKIRFCLIFLLVLYQ
jgi:hypothetical protein